MKVCIPMIRTQIQVEKEQMQWLKRHAHSRGISMSQLVRDSIDSYRSQVEQHKKHVHKKKNALRAVGRFAAKPDRAK